MSTPTAAGAEPIRATVSPRPGADAGAPPGRPPDAATVDLEETLTDLRHHQEHPGRAGDHDVIGGRDGPERPARPGGRLPHDAGERVGARAIRCSHQLRHGRHRHAPRALYPEPGSRFSADAEARHQRPHREPEADERGPRERHPRAIRLPRRSPRGSRSRRARRCARTRTATAAAARTRSAGRSGPSCRRRRAPRQQQHDPEDRLQPGRHLRDAEPHPVPLARTAPRDRRAETPDPADGEDAHDGEPDEPVDLRHARSLRVRDALVPGAAAAARSLLSRRDRCRPSRANSSALAATPGLSSLTSSRSSSFARPGRSSNCARTSAAGHAVGDLGREPGPVEPRQHRLEVEPRQPAAEDLEDGGPRRACDDLLLAALLDRVELHSAQRRRHDGRQVADARDGLGLAGDGGAADRRRARASPRCRSSTAR